MTTKATVKRPETCSTCRHWRTIDEHRGECLRHAPRPTTLGDLAFSTRTEAREAVWPVTFAAARCGEWEEIR
jgi:hypothetical protein